MKSNLRRGAMGVVALGLLGMASTAQAACPAYGTILGYYGGNTCATTSSNHAPCGMMKVVHVYSDGGAYIIGFFRNDYYQWTKVDEKIATCS